jgi:hypothetical protein
MTASSRILGETRANRKLWREVNLTKNARPVEVNPDGCLQIRLLGIRLGPPSPAVQSCLETIARLPSEDPKAGRRRALADLRVLIRRHFRGLPTNRPGTFRERRVAGNEPPGRQAVHFDALGNFLGREPFSEPTTAGSR